MRRLPLGKPYRAQRAAAGGALPAGKCAALVGAPMVVNRRLVRRAVAAAAIVGGAFFLWLSPEQLVGVLTMLAGIALEAIGIHLDHA